MNYKIKYPILFISWILLIGYLVIFSLGMLQSLDTNAYQTISSYTSVSTTSFMIAITFFGSWLAVVIICLIVMVIHFKKGVILSMNIAIVWILNYMIKFIVARPRPSVIHLVIEDNYSFPSAHAMVSFALFGFIAYLLWKKYKILSVIIILIVPIIGISRIYLGVHYTSDVIAGYLFAFTYLQ